jgi:hypothetical protein
MSLADIDAAATARRIREIADNARKAFEAQAQRSAEIDAASREAAAKEEADRKAVEERKAEARKVADEQPKPSPTPRPSPRPRPKPATLELGAEEFKLDRQARQAAEEPKQVESEAKEPQRKRPPRPEVDDDMSGRSWLR